MSDPSIPDEATVRVKLDLGSSPAFTAGLQSASQALANASRMAQITESARKAIAESAAPATNAVSEQMAAIAQEMQKSIIGGVSGQMAESLRKLAQLGAITSQPPEFSPKMEAALRKLAQQAGALSTGGITWPEVIYTGDQVEASLNETATVADSVEDLRELHQDLLSSLKKDKTEARVFFVITVLLMYLASKDELVESTSEHAAEVQQAVTSLWGYLTTLLVWLGHSA